MARFTFSCLFTLLLFSVQATPRTVHVFVALCDNEHQGIVPVPATLGNGKDARNNLYWGAAYGVRSYFRYKTSDWSFVKELPSKNPFVLERVLFKHVSADVYLLADAYDGERIKTCTEDFLKASNGQYPIELNVNDSKLSFGGSSDLVAYIGHDGLMDFEVSINYQPTEISRDVIVLACASKSYFNAEIQKANAKPVLWTTNLMAPEAYTLKAALDGWILKESDDRIMERAAQAYSKYQKCGITGARRLFSTGL